MESPVVVDKPPEYHANGAEHEKGFPFDEEEGSSAWSELAARHPDIAARLRSRPSAWPRKRRSSNQSDASDDFGSSLGDRFSRFPFDDIPTEFREHFPSHWSSRFGPSEETTSHSPVSPQRFTQQPPSSQQQTTATQTEDVEEPDIVERVQTLGPLPQYGLRNTVDLGQKTPADPCLADSEDGRNHRSMSAPPDNRGPSRNNSGNMMGGNGQLPQEHQGSDPSQSNVRHIPIFVEGRDEPIINKSADHAPHFAEAKPAYVPPVDREQYFTEKEGPIGFHHPPNFSRAFGTPFNKGFRQGPQPFVQQKVYPQSAYTRATSPPGRSHSPKRQGHNPVQTDEPCVKLPVHHEPRSEPTPSRPAHQQPAPAPAHSPPPPQQQAPPQQPLPQQPSVNDPISKILLIQKDVLDLMTEVENFTGKKTDKRYIYLDEMLTRNLIKLDDIETEGKENIRQARREAIKCIQKCIAVLEAKADGRLQNNQLSKVSDVKAASSDIVTNQEPENENDPEVIENGAIVTKEAEAKEPVAATHDGTTDDSLMQAHNEESQHAENATKKNSKKT